MKTIIDTAVVLLYIGGVVLVTLRVARKQKNKEDFIMAGRSMHWFPLALSGVAASLVQSVWWDVRDLSWQKTCVICRHCLWALPVFP